MKMILILVLVVSLFVLGIVLLLYLKQRRKCQEDPDIVISGGVDIDKRQKVKAPRHLSQEDDHTVFISKHQITLELIAIADNKRYAFPCSHTIEIGRQQLDGQPAISKLHCKFSYHEDQLYIEDHHSQNHTFVNDVQIFETTKISEQDVIRLAGSSYQVRIRK